MSKLQGKVAVVTGASKGIGASIAKALAAEGAAVVVNYASGKAGAEAVVKAIEEAGGRAVAAAIEAFGRLDVLVNNAGVYEMAPLEALTEAQYRRMFDINVWGLLAATQAASPHLGSGASVINLGSVVSSLRPPGSTVYTGTKGAVDAITGVLANELGPRGVRVNTIAPGLTDTPGAHAVGFMGSPMEAHTAASTPLRRVGQPDDIATVAVFLASDDSRWVTGERILVSGGMR